MDTYALVTSRYGNKTQQTIGYYEITPEGKVEVERLYSGYENPSFLEQINGKLVVIQEKDNEGIISTHNMRQTGLEVIDTITVPGTDLCHIIYSKRWSILLGACYGTGHVFALSVSEEGQLKCLNLIQQSSSEQGVSRAHCMSISPTEDYVYGVNIASDQIVCYKLDEKGITPNHLFAYLQLPKGEGPRHMKWHPRLPVAYVITEYSNRLFVLESKKTSGKLQVIQSMELLQSQKEESYGSTFCINQAGTYLYAANRGADTITQFAITVDGRLEYIQETSAYGCWPRHIALTKDDNYLLIANQKSGEVNVVKIDTQSGNLGKLTRKVDFPEVSFIEEWKVVSKNLSNLSEI